MCVWATPGPSDGHLVRPSCEAGALLQPGLTGGDILCINKPLSYLQELFSYRAKTLLTARF